MLTRMVVAQVAAVQTAAMQPAGVQEAAVQMAALPMAALQMQPAVLRQVEAKNDLHGRHCMHGSDVQIRGRGDAVQLG